MDTIGFATIGGIASLPYWLTRWVWFVVALLSFSFLLSWSCWQGKTVQIVTFLGTLIEKFKAAPALVVVPNSTITNWVREFSRWAPRLRVVPFYGESKARDVIIRYELFHGSSKKGTTEPKYHVLVTTYESVTNAKDFIAVFKSVPRWEVLVVDEGQRREYLPLQP
jgi:SNF2 family DNA or RNA helicase